MERNKRIEACKAHFEANEALAELHVTEDGQVFESVNYANAHSRSAKHESKPLKVTRADVEALEAKAAPKPTKAEAKAAAEAKAKEEAEVKAKEEAEAKAKEEAEPKAKEEANQQNAQ